MTKICSRCKEEKPLSEYRQRKDKACSHESHCKDCGRLYHREWYQKNKKSARKRMNAQERERRLSIRRNIREYLEDHSCVDCGESRPATLDFDHVRGKKAGNVANMVSNYTWGRIKEEIRKCEVRCANCHREKTAQERGWYQDLAR